jgi:hypothetical protein
MSDRYLFIPITKTAISDDKSKTAKPVGSQYYIPTYYPNITVTEQDTYIITKGTDRLDLIANDFYGDSTLWWIISAANNNITRGLLFPVPGTQLRIPLNIGAILAEFNDFNQAR